MPPRRTLQQRVARTVKRLRLARGWTQGTLAAKLQVESPYISQIESGDRGVSLEILGKLARIFRVPPGSFFD